MIPRKNDGPKDRGDGKPKAAGRRVLWVLMPLFFLSGASSLVFENLWTRALVIVFGSSHFATSTVLATFMGGLGLGSFIAGRYVDRVKDLGKLLGVYGLLEGVVGLYGLALPLLIALVEGFNVFVWTHWQPSFYTFSLLRFVVVGLLLLPPTTCMGATLPILSRYLCASRKNLGREAGTLYAVNTFGAVAGTFAGGFLFMPLLGMSVTNYTACAINMALFGAALWLMRSSLGQRRDPSGAEVGQAGGEGPAGQADDADSAVSAPPAEGPLAQRLVVWGIGLSGGVAMVYQLAWTRTLSLILGSSVYAFTLILICFLLGLAAGGALYARRTASRDGQVANLAVIHIVIAVAAVAGLLLTDKLPPTFLVLMRILRLHPTSAFVSKFVVSAALMLVPTFFMGMIFPATIKVASEAGRALGWTVGSVYAINTVGSIAGSFIGGFLLIPHLGLQFTIALMILVNITMAIVFAAVNGTTGRGGRVGRAAVAGLVALGLAVVYSPWDLQVMISGVFRVSVYDVAQKTMERQRAAERLAFRKTPGWKGWSKWADVRIQGLQGRPTTEEPLVDSELVFYKEGVVTTVSMTRSLYEGLAGAACWETLSLQVNGKADASVTGKFNRPKGRDCQELAKHPKAFGPPVGVSIFGDTETQVMSGLLGVLLSDPASELRYANVVGWGSGITVGSAAKTPLQEVEAVELEIEVIKAARWFLRYNHDAEHHRKVKLIEGDGRTYLSATKRRYDIIVSEPSNPWITGCSNLFTVEYFKLVKSRLKKSGKFVQWLQVYEISPRNVKVILNTLSSVFPHVHIFRPGFSPADLLLVAGRRPLVLDYRWLKHWLATRGTGAEAKRIGIHTPEDVFVRSVLDSEGLKRYVAGAELNTDDNALVEFSAPKDLINYYKYDPQEIADSLNARARPLREVVRNLPPDFELRLAKAWLRAGFTKRALELVEGKPSPAAREVLRIVKLLRGSKFDAQALAQVAKKDPKIASEIQRIGKLPKAQALREALRSPVLKKRRALGAAVVGFYLSENNQLRDALRLLWAAWETSSVQARPAMGRLLTSWARQMGLAQMALNVARRTLSQKTSPQKVD